MLKYKAGYKYVDGGVHAQVVDFPAAITCAADLTEARRLLTGALLDVAEARLEFGRPLPTPNPRATDPEMDIEEPIYLHLSASSEIDGMGAAIIACSRSPDSSSSTQPSTRISRSSRSSVARSRRTRPAASPTGSAASSRMSSSRIFASRRPSRSTRATSRTRTG